MIFDADKLETCINNEKKKLSKECKAQIKKDMGDLNNPYVLLAYKFLWYNAGGEDNTGDWFFYKYLKSLGYKDHYEFPTKEGNITVNVKLFEPFVNQKEGIINPRWHFLVSFYAYLDAAFNHPDKKFAKDIAVKNSWYAAGTKCPDDSDEKIWKRKTTYFNCKSLKMWLDTK